MPGKRSASAAVKGPRGGGMQEPNASEFVADADLDPPQRRRNVEEAVGVKLALRRDAVGLRWRRAATGERADDVPALGVNARGVADRLQAREVAAILDAPTVVQHVQEIVEHRIDPD